MSFFLAERPLVFVATQTTGGDDGRHEILDLAILDGRGRTLLHTAVKPEALHTAHPEALEGAGYNEGEWAPSPLFGSLARQILVHLSDAVVVGHDTHFDVRFVLRLLRKSFAAEGFSEEEIEDRLRSVPRHWVDTATLAWEHLAPCGLRSLDLDVVCAFVGAPTDDPPSALFTARRTRQVHETLLRATWLQRWWWARVGPARAARVEG